MSPHAAVVFAGGASTRMGVDKATLQIEGTRLIERVVAAVSSADDVVIAGGEATSFVGIAARWVADEYPGEGPLGALLTGFGCTSADLVVSCACDLPHLRADDVSTLVDELERTGADLCVPLVRGVAQWHVAAWNRRCYPQLVEVFASGRRSLRSAGLMMRTTHVVFADVSGFVDVDTPGDLRRDFPE